VALRERCCARSCCLRRSGWLRSENRLAATSATSPSTTVGALRAAPTKAAAATQSAWVRAQGRSSFERSCGSWCPRGATLAGAGSGRVAGGGVVPRRSWRPGAPVGEAPQPGGAPRRGPQGPLRVTSGTSPSVAMRAPTAATATASLATQSTWVRAQGRVTGRVREAWEVHCPARPLPRSRPPLSATIGRVGRAGRFILQCPAAWLSRMAREQVSTARRTGLGGAMLPSSLSRGTGLGGATRPGAGIALHDSALVRLPGRRNAPRRSALCDCPGRHTTPRCPPRCDWPGGSMLPGVLSALRDRPGRRGWRNSQHCTTFVQETHHALALAHSA
jgi:hypothetical protein